MKKVKRIYQFGKNQKKASNNSKESALNKEQIKRKLKEINKLFLTLVPQKRIIANYGKPIPIKDEMVKQVTIHLGRSAKYKTKEYIKNFCKSLIDNYLLFSKCKEEKKEYEDAYKEIRPCGDIEKLLDTIYTFSTTKEHWDTNYLKQENVSDEVLKENLYNACVIDCIGLYNCYANSLCKEEDDILTRVATMITIMLREDFQDLTAEEAENITDVVGGCALAACKVHNHFCIKMNRYDCFTLFC